MAKKKSSKGIKLRNAMKKGKYPTEIVGYFLNSNREFVRDEMSRMNTLFDKYIRGKAFMKKVHTFDGSSNNSFFIDFTEYKPKTKKLTAYKKMQDILKRAASAGVISKGMASSFKAGKIIAPVVDGKIELSGLDYEDVKVKPANKSKNKTLTMTQLLKEIHQKLSAKGYLIRPFEKEKSKSNRKSKQKSTYYMSLLSGAEYWMRVSRNKRQPFYSIEFVPQKSLVKPYKEIFHSKSMHFDQVDEKVLIQMLKRMKIKPSSISKKQHKSKETTKVTTIPLVPEWFKIFIEPPEWFRKDYKILAKTFFKGKKFSLTGTLNGFTRDSFVKMAEKLGGKFQNHISKDLDMLIVGEKPGKTKVAQAKKYKIEMIVF